MKRNILFNLIVVLLFTLLSPNNASALYGKQSEASALHKIDPQVQAALANLQTGGMVTAIVTLTDQADLSQFSGARRAARRQGVVRSLRTKMDTSQRQIRALLSDRSAKGKVSQVKPFWVFNGLSITASPEVIQELAARPDVLKITPDETDIVPAAPLSYGQPEANIAIANAPALWNLGYYGQGVVVANMDTGVDIGHPDLSARWRGGANSWYDPYGQHPATPTDLSGHGTWTMGVMVGGDSGGTSIGVAPQAQWIAVKMFNDAGSATATAIHLSFQWLLDPDGNPNTDDAPQVVNNSWAYGSPGCNLDFQSDLRALRAAGIVPVFSAGNYGPNSPSSVSPANYPEALAVGATDYSDQVYVGSSRGPSECGETSTVYPELVAPGVDIRTTDRYGLYTSATGTSLSAPHVAGGLALLLSAFPDLTADTQVAALLNSAVDLGPAGPDNDYGYGRLDLLSAYNWLVGGGLATPTPTNTDTPTATSTLAITPTDTPTLSPVPLFTDTPTPLPTFTDTPLPSDTPTPLPTNTPTPLPTSTNTPLPTNTATPLPTFTRTRTPTATSTKLPTALPTATRTPTPAPANTMHVGDLDRSSTLSGTRWNATVTIYVHNAGEKPVANATVSGKWTNGATGTVSCITNTRGTCQVSKTKLTTSTLSVTFTVTNVTRATYTYSSAANHDPDVDSNGTSIIVLRP